MRTEELLAKIRTDKADRPFSVEMAETLDEVKHARFRPAPHKRINVVENGRVVEKKFENLHGFLCYYEDKMIP